MTAQVRELLDLAADRVTGDLTARPEAPVAAVVSAGRDRARRRRLRALGGAAGAVLAVAAGGLAVQQFGADTDGGPVTLLTGRGSEGDRVCGGVRFDRAQLPGRPLREDDPFGDLGDLADLLWLHGWPRAVPLDAASWTVLTGRGDALLVARMPSGEVRYLPVTRQRDGSWLAGAPCTPRRRR